MRLHHKWRVKTQPRSVQFHVGDSLRVCHTVGPSRKDLCARSGSLHTWIAQSPSQPLNVSRSIAPAELIGEAKDPQRPLSLVAHFLRYLSVMQYYLHAPEVGNYLK